MIHKKIYSLFIVAILSCMAAMVISSCANQKAHKHHKKKKHVVHREEAEAQDTIPAPYHYKYKMEKLTHADSFQIKPVYKVALILPFDLDSFYPNRSAIAFNNIPKAVYPALDFYEGCLVAVDSFKNTKVNIELNVIDYSNRHNFETIAAKYKLNEMDLLLGTLNSSDARVVADFAKTNKINFVSPVASSFVPEFNPYYLALNPNVANQQIKLLEIIEQKYGNELNTLVIRQNNAAEENVASASISNVMKKFAGAHPVELILPSRTAVDSIVAELDSIKHNVVFLASNDWVFANAVLKKLSIVANHYPITVLGMPSWINHDNLKNAVGKNLEVLFTNSYLLNRTNYEYQRFHRNFTNRYHIRPSELAIRGYTTMLLCGAMLQQYGARFNYFMHDVYPLLYGKLQLKPVWGKERKRTYIQYFNNQELEVMRLNNNGIQLYKAQ